MSASILWETKKMSIFAIDEAIPSAILFTCIQHLTPNMKKHTFLLLALLAGCLGLNAQVTVTVVTTDGNEHAITLDASGELEISSQALVVYASTRNETLYTYALDDVRKVLFSGSVGIQRVEDGPAISLYPNPTGDRFVVEGLAEGTHTLSLFSLSGTEVMRTSYKNGQQVDIHSLPEGTYLVRVAGSTAKIVKQ